MVDTHVSPKRTRNKLQGKLRQRTRNGNYSYRLTSSTGARKEFTLQTRNYDEAVLKASELDSIWLAPTREVALAQMSAIRGFSEQAKKISFEEAWEIYQVHPNRATPHSVEERIGYRKTFEMFSQFASEAIGKSKRAETTCICEVTSGLCEKFSAYLKTTSLSVHTHNRKIKRLRKIFECLKDYYEGENPFRSKTLMRSECEERGSIVHRQAFTREQEEQLVAVLSDSDPKHKLMNKAEIRVLYIIGRFTGQRLKDCVLMQWQNVDMTNRRIWVKQFKTGKEVTIPIALDLYDALLEAEKWRRDQYILPKSAARYRKTNAEGKNVGNNLIDIDVLRPIRWIGLEPSVSVPGRKKKMTVYGFHSHRHSFASFCAEEGVPKAVVQSILGIDSEIVDRYYTHVSEESQRKAVEAVSSRSTPISQEKIDRVLNLLMPDGKQLDTTADSTIRQVLKILKGA